MNRAFNYNKITASNYTDVSAGDWFLEEIGKAEAAGYLVGYADSLLKPNQEISRQEVCRYFNKDSRPGGAEGCGPISAGRGIYDRLSGRQFSG